MGEKGRHEDFAAEEIGSAESGRARLRAAWIVDRWKRQGFDAVTLSPSGYCCPLNRSIMRTGPPEGYRMIDIDSDDAVTSVEGSIKAGTAYRL